MIPQRESAVSALSIIDLERVSDYGLILVESLRHCSIKTVRAQTGCLRGGTFRMAASSSSSSRPGTTRKPSRSHDASCSFVHKVEFSDVIPLSAVQGSVGSVGSVVSVNCQARVAVLFWPTKKWKGK
jgi:hypothetical protein